MNQLLQKKISLDLEKSPTESVRRQHINSPLTVQHPVQHHHTPPGSPLNQRQSIQQQKLDSPPGKYLEFYVRGIQCIYMSVKIHIHLPREKPLVNSSKPLYNN